MSVKSKPKWTWMMDWCKHKGLPPANMVIWKIAEKAYKEMKKRT